MKHFKKYLFGFFIVSSMVFLPACDNDGPAEEAGEAVDEAVEDVTN